MFEDILDIKDYGLYQAYIGITEQADAQRLAQTAQEQVMMESQTPSGLNQDDFDADLVGGMEEQLGGPMEGEFPIEQTQQ